MRKIFICVLFLTSFTCSSESLVNIEYQAPIDKDQQLIYQLIVDSGVNDDFIELVDTLFPFEQSVKIIYVSSDNEGPYYDPEKQSISIPYAFVLEARYFFSKHRASNEVNKGAMDTLMHTLLHETGHALIEDNNIPVLGKEEDAVDNLATIVMLNYLEGGRDAAINAADMFDYESDSGGEYYDFAEYAGVHSFDLQRYFATLCLIYGSDPKENASLLDEIEKDYLAEQQQTCEETYDQLYDSWHRYLHDS